MKKCLNNRAKQENLDLSFFLLQKLDEMPFKIFFHIFLLYPIWVIALDNKEFGKVRISTQLYNKLSQISKRTPEEEL